VPEPDSQELVVVERRGAVATVILNRKERHNGLTNALKVALRDHLAKVGADPGVRAVVLTGAGPSFCVGQDLAEHAAALESAGGDGALSTVDVHYNPMVRALTTMPKPVVAAINGNCVGAGLGLALACDLRLAGEGAKFGTAFTGIGLGPDSGLSATLSRAVGASRATELVLLAERFDSAQAAAWGLLHQVVPGGELDGAAAALADRLASGPTAAYAEAKAVLSLAWSPLEEVLAAESAAQRRLGVTEDHRNAVAAFLAKAEPTFTGR
jgi:2-(1,2-epoxy-1,2-dihydrophenyl)acetyl-CoA isomerase